GAERVGTAENGFFDAQYLVLGHEQVFGPIVVAAAAAQAVRVPGILDDQLVGAAERETALGQAVVSEHQLAVAGEHAAAHHHVGMSDPAAERKAAIEHISAFDRSEERRVGKECRKMIELDNRNY